MAGGDESSELWGWEISVLFLLFAGISIAWQGKSRHNGTLRINNVPVGVVSHSQVLVTADFVATPLI